MENLFNEIVVAVNNGIQITYAISVNDGSFSSECFVPTNVEKRCDGISIFKGNLEKFIPNCHVECDKDDNYYECSTKSSIISFEF